MTNFAGAESNRHIGAVSTRRRIVLGAAWAAPAVVASVPAPSVALSDSCQVVVATTGLAGSGYDLYLRDGKATNSNTNTSGASITVVNLTLRVVCASSAAGLPFTVAGDNIKDGEGNFMIGFSPATQTTGFGESTTQRTATGTTNAAGEFTVKVSTATYSAADCGSIPRSGTWTVTVDNQPFGFTYVIYDGPTTIAC